MRKWQHRMPRWLELIGVYLGLCAVLGLTAAPSRQPVAASLLPTPPFVTLSPTPPTQGGHGKDVYNLRCMPCHGDRGQGLTDEFRFRVFPTEDANCWNSGCHGNQPYFNGFTLPRSVPALIGPDALQHFKTAQDLYNFISKAMPFSAPGALSPTEYLQVEAFLLESNHIVPAGVQLDSSSLAKISLRAGSATPTPSAPDQVSTPAQASDISVVLLGILIFLVVAVLLSL